MIACILCLAVAAFVAFDQAAKSGDPDGGGEVAAKGDVAPGAEPSAEQMRFFETSVRPILVEHCQKCHGEKKQEGGLRLDTRAGWQKGGEHGPVIVPGDPEKSRLILAVRRKDKDFQMPPKRALGTEEVAALEQWIKLGAPDPRETTAVATAGEDPAVVRKHWAFQPLTHPQPPEAKLNPWS